MKEEGVTLRILLSSLAVVCVIGVSAKLLSNNPDDVSVLTVERPKAVGQSSGASTVLPHAARSFEETVGDETDGAQLLPPSELTDDGLAILTVHVVDTDGSSVADCAVSVRAVGVEGGESPLKRGATGRNGEATFRSAEGRYRVEALSNDPAFFGQNVISVGGDAGGIDLEVVVSPLEAVHGVVLDELTGRPIGGVRIGNLVTRALIGEAESVVTDSLGRFTFPYGLRDTTASINFRRDGFAFESLSLLMMKDHGWAILGAEPKAPEWQDGDVFLQVSLLQAREITGSCVDEKGRPLSGVPVRARGSYAESFAIHTPDEDECVTDEFGFFKLTGLRPDIEHLVVVDEHAVGFASRCVRVGDASDLGTITLGAGAAVTGHVYGPGNEPVRGAIVSASIRGRQSCTNTSGVSYERATHTDSHGEFNIPSLPGGVVEVKVLLGRWTAAQRSGIDCMPGESKDLGDMVVKGEIDLLHGHVFTQAGFPIRGCQLTVHDSHEIRHAIGRTDTAGYFALSAHIGDRRNEFTLTATGASGDVLGTWNVQAGQQPLDLRVAQH